MFMSIKSLFRVSDKYLRTTRNHLKNMVPRPKKYIMTDKHLRTTGNNPKIYGPKAKKKRMTAINFVVVVVEKEPSTTKSYYDVSSRTVGSLFSAGDTMQPLA